MVPGVRFRAVAVPGGGGYKAQLVAKTSGRVMLTSTRVFATKAAARRAMDAALKDVDRATRQLAAAKRRGSRRFGSRLLSGRAGRMPYGRVMPLLVKHFRSEKVALRVVEAMRAEDPHGYYNTIDMPNTDEAKADSIISWWKRHKGSRR